MNLPAAISLAAAVVGLAVAGLALGLGSSPRWARYRLLAVTALFASLYCGLDVISTLELRPVLLLRLSSVQSMVGAFHVVMWLVYADRQLGRAASPWQNVLRIGMALMGVGWLVPGLLLDGSTTRFTVDALDVAYQYPTPNRLGAVVFTLEVTCLVVLLARFVSAARRGVAGASIHAVAIGIGLVAAVYDTVVTIGVIQGPFLLPLSFIGAVGALGAILTRAFVVDARQLDVMTHRLEQLVEERTKELVATEGALMRAEKLAAIGQLSAGVAHEINNPAAAVMGNLEYLREELENARLGDETFACIDDSLDAIDRIAKIVRQLLDIGRTAAIAPTSDATSVSRAVQQALVSARSALPRASVVTTEVCEDLFVRGDEGSLVQVLVNLITNAGHAIAASAGGRVLIRAVESGDDVFISVTDDGVGMSEETKRRLFEPFYTTKPFGKGTGLGLSLSLGIVQSLGGDLLVDARPGETTMRVRLPVATAPSPMSSGRTRARQRRRSLLLVEDDLRVRRALERTLASRFDLAVASGVDEALERIADQSFDLVLSDWKMPNGGGRRLYERMAEQRPELAHATLFMTGGRLSPAERAFVERHEMTILDKPLAVDALLAAVREIEKNTHRTDALAR